MLELIRELWAGNPTYDEASLNSSFCKAPSNIAPPPARLVMFTSVLSCNRFVLCLLMVLMCVSMMPDDAAASPARKFGNHHHHHHPRAIHSEEADNLPAPLPKRHLPVPGKRHHPKASKVAVSSFALPPRTSEPQFPPYIPECLVHEVPQAYFYLFFEEITPPPPKEC